MTLSHPVPLWKRLPGAPCCPLSSFLRAPDGSLTTFNVAGAGDAYATGINPEGAITGLSSLGGFLRARDGTFTIFNVPGAVGTAPFVINPAGAITGYYYDASDMGHGFLWIP
jgi:hypothetical protein